MLEEGSARKLKYDDRTFCALLVACGEAGALDAGKSVHQIALDHGAGKGVEFLSSLLFLFARCGEFSQAEALLARLTREKLANAVTYNVMINGLFALPLCSCLFRTLQPTRRLGSFRRRSRVF